MCEHTVDIYSNTSFPVHFEYLPQFSKHCVLRRISHHIVVTFSMMFLIVEKKGLCV
jgi:hypothetical protein